MLPSISLAAGPLPAGNGPVTVEVAAARWGVIPSAGGGTLWYSEDLEGSVGGRH